MPDSKNQDLYSPIDFFYKWEKETPNAIFLKQPDGRIWHKLSYGEVGNQARKMVSALRKMGMQKGDHIGILSKNCCHWIIADIAIMMGGFVSVPFYASLPKKQLAEVIKASDIKLLFLGKLEKWGDKGDAIPNEVTCIKFPHYKGNAVVDRGLAWNKILEENEPSNDLAKNKLDDIWTILFTSGTTGTPKGVVHTFRNPAIVIAGEKESNFIGVFKIKSQRYFSFLPLNHVAERIAVETACLATGSSISFAESIDTFVQNLQDTQPTTIFAVPRIWTKFYLGVLERLPQKKMDLFLKIPFLSSWFKNKLKTKLGLRDAKIVATGAAITPAHVKSWYKKLDIHLVEAYGMTEVCGAICNSPDPNSPYDSVGTVVPGCEVKIDPITQEILMKSPFAMKGYYKEPEKTSEVLKDGWVYSGDRGTIDENGFVRVIGRVKDSFKTEKGKYIIPNPIEESLCQNKNIEQICLVGLTCPQPLAIINLSEAGKLQANENIESSLTETLQTVNKELENYERISTIVIDSTSWTEENEILTPTLKVKRNKIEELYKDNYLNWHEADNEIIWK